MIEYKLIAIKRRDKARLKPFKISPKDFLANRIKESGANLTK
jgi:hypothetical protein